MAEAEAARIERVRQGFRLCAPAVAAPLHALRRASLLTLSVKLASNSMNLRNAENGTILWQETEDLYGGLAVHGCVRGLSPHGRPYSLFPLGP